jgi:RecB family exonuclease
MSTSHPPLSPSRAKDFLQCPRLYYYKTILGIKTPPTEATLRGTLAHYAFEHVFNHPPQERTVETALTYVEPAWSMLRDPLVGRATVEEGSPEHRLRSAENRFREAIEPGSEDEERLLTEAAAALLVVPAERSEEFIETVRVAVRGWFAMENPAKFEPADRERYVRAKVGKALVHGFIDRLDIIEDKSGVNRVFVSDYKGLALNTPLPTPKGWTTMERVRVGDWLLSPAGTPVQVVEKTPEQVLDCYELLFGDGSRVVADAVHLWPLADGRVLSTTELLPLVTEAPVALPAVGVMDLPAQDLPLSPYIAGGSVTRADFLHPHSPEYVTVLRASRGSVEQRLDILRGAASVSPTGSIVVRDSAIAELLAECATLSGVGPLRFSREREGLRARFREADRAPQPCIVKVTQVKSRPTACVAVDSEDRLYLAGPGMVPTHNTGKKPSERFADEAFFQLEVYAAALKESDGLETYQLRLLYTNEGRADSVLTRKVDAAVLERTKKKLAAVWDGIRQAEKTSRWPTRKQRLCDWCYFKDVCPAFHPELEGLLPEEVEQRLSRPDAG